MTESARGKWTPAEREEDQFPELRGGHEANHRRLRGRLQNDTGLPIPGSDLVADGSVDQAVKARRKAAWMNWRESSCTLCDRRCSKTIKGKVYRTVLKLTMLYGSECWPVGVGPDWIASEMKSQGPQRRDS
ncbi:unnamed protein product [Haemonchus placei]|uniref:Uncharacterized protein n=1 Tax=Haemonchus placei TaxID=6290 RepID=A0A0N4WC74_HAEPC|nr:unnamed protein product [Haemonchus placei]